MAKTCERSPLNYYIESREWDRLMCAETYKTPTTTSYGDSERRGNTKYQQKNASDQSQADELISVWQIVSI